VPTSGSRALAAARGLSVVALAQLRLSIDSGESDVVSTKQRSVARRWSWRDHRIRVSERAGHAICASDGEIAVERGISISVPAITRSDRRREGQRILRVNALAWPTGASGASAHTRGDAPSVSPPGCDMRC
jgi:hypothetical protein